MTLGSGPSILCPQADRPWGRIDLNCSLTRLACDPAPERGMAGLNA